MTRASSRALRIDATIGAAATHRTDIRCGNQAGKLSFEPKKICENIGHNGPPRESPAMLMGGALERMRQITQMLRGRPPRKAF